MKRITVKSESREEMIEITAEVEKHLPASDGVCVLFTQHTTCGLTINENADPDVKSDMLGFLQRLIPQSPTAQSVDHPAYETSALNPTGKGEFLFQHSEGNSDAHIKSSLVGSSATVPFENGELCLGRWQGIYLCEFDGPRERQVLVKFL